MQDGIRTPLNGTKTHPLSDVAKATIVCLNHGPIPYSQINAGVIDRLMREYLVETVMLPSPFITHRGKSIRHIKLTDAGRALLQNGVMATRTIPPLKRNLTPDHFNFTKRTTP